MREPNQSRSKNTQVQVEFKRLVGFVFKYYLYIIYLYNRITYCVCGSGEGG